jgi:hypothetical protein
LASTDFGKLPERVDFSEIVMKRHSLVPKFMFPSTIVYASEEVQAYYKLMHVTQKKIENANTNIVNNHGVTTNELLQPLFSWILGSFDLPLPVKFATAVFTPLLMRKRVHIFV